MAGVMSFLYGSVAAIIITIDNAKVQSKLTTGYISLECSLWEEKSKSASFSLTGLDERRVKVVPSARCQVWASSCERDVPGCAAACSGCDRSVRVSRYIGQSPVTPSMGMGTRGQDCGLERKWRIIHWAQDSLRDSEWVRLQEVHYDYSIKYSRF